MGKRKTIEQQNNFVEQAAERLAELFVAQIDLEKQQDIERAKDEQ